MKILVLISTLLMTASCVSKTLVKNCVPTVDSPYSVCDTVILK